MNIWLAAILLAVVVLTGCQSPKTMSASGYQASSAVRNNGYSLLHQLLAEQKDVSLLHFIKSEHPEVKKLVKRIAANSATGATLLEKFAADDRTIDLNDLQLPPGEMATRDAIASTKQKELLGQTGDRFELTLLLTQTEALSYAWHLAEVTAQNEPQPERARALVGLGQDMEKLYYEVFRLLLAKTEATVTNPATTHLTSLPAAPAMTSSGVTSQTLMIDPSSMPVGAGKATLIIGALQHGVGVYLGKYKIKVFPWFLKNENGTLTIVVSDASLANIKIGQVTAITGTATTSGKGGSSRHIEATATPVDLNHGKLKLWFTTAGNRKMTFAPTYHFTGINPPPVLAQVVGLQTPPIQVNGKFNNKP
jgi:hypothetical protein